jgi:hypothetical protein
LIFIKKGGEIRLCETLATNPYITDGRRKVPKPNPGKPGDDKNKHGNNENTSSDSKTPNRTVHAYVHGPVRILIWKQSPKQLK